MDLAEELKKEEQEAFDKWFDRWFEKENFPSKLKIAANQGYDCIYTSKMRERSKAGDPEYFNRRLRDPRTVEKLKERLPSLNIEFKSELRKTWAGTHMLDEKLVISWK